jgi:hypothetical protein
MNDSIIVMAGFKSFKSRHSKSKNGEFTNVNEPFFDKNNDELKLLRQPHFTNDL